MRSGKTVRRQIIDFLGEIQSKELNMAGIMWFFLVSTEKYVCWSIIINRRNGWLS